MTSQRPNTTSLRPVTSQKHQTLRFSITSQCQRRPNTDHKPERRPQTTNRQAMTIGTDEYYLGLIRTVLYDRELHPEVKLSPTQILDYLYLGNYWDAQNVHYLRRLGITHVINCAALPGVTSQSPYRLGCGIVGYLQFAADDHVTYNMLQHVNKARAFISRARQYGGKVLVHCEMGMNRSSLIVAAYLMGEHKLTLVNAIKLLVSKRGTILRNPGFQKQLVRYAKIKGKL